MVAAMRRRERCGGDSASVPAIHVFLLSQIVCAITALSTVGSSANAALTTQWSGTTAALVVFRRRVNICSVNEIVVLSRVLRFWLLAD